MTLADPATSINSNDTEAKKHVQLLAPGKFHPRGWFILKMTTNSKPLLIKMK